MKLYDVLKEYGLFANEIKQRLQNGQILVNGDPEGGDFDMGNVAYIYDQGFFLQELYKIPNYDKWANQIMFIGLENLMNKGSNIQNDLTEFLHKYIMVQISKEVTIFIKTSSKQSDEIIIHKETFGKSKIKVEIPKEVDTSDQIKKLKSDRDKVKAQLSNPGFVKNAPQFKIDAAQNRLNVINSKLTELGVNESFVKKFNDFK